MNIFHIPSWYPSGTDPLPGIFMREQALLYAGQYPGDRIGISHWGQNDERLLLWSRAPLHSFRQIVAGRRISGSREMPAPNLNEYFEPAFTWTRRLCSGNLHGILKANETNYRRFCRDFGPADLLHAHVGYPAGVLAAALAARHGLPYVITEYMSPFPFRYFASRGRLIAPLRDAYHGAQAVVALSEGLRQKMRTAGVARTEVIAQPVDEYYFSPAPVPAATGAFSFFALGRLVEQKGFDLLLMAFAQLMAENPGLTLRIGGAGPEEQSLRRLAQHLGIAERVHWLGGLDRAAVRAEMQHCSAFVLGSRHESLGIVFIEAIACGKPVIGTACGGPEEVINGTNGYLVPAEDPQALAGAMERMTVRYTSFDPAAIRRDFEARFASAVVCRQLRALYERVVEEHRRGRRT